MSDINPDFDPYAGMPDLSQKALAALFTAVLADAGYTPTTAPKLNTRFRVGPAFKLTGLGAFWGIPIVVDNEAPLTSIVFEEG